MRCVENLTRETRAFAGVVLEPGLNAVPDGSFQALENNPRFQAFVRAGRIRVHDENEFERRIERLKRGELALESVPVPEQVKLVRRITDPDLIRHIAENTKSLTTLRVCLERLEALRR